MKPMTAMRVVLVAAAITLVGGCGVLQTISENAQTARDVMDIATLYAIEQADDRAAEARAIIAEAKDFKRWVDFESVTFDELVAKARERIARSDRELSEKAGLNILLRRADALLRDKVSAGALTPEDKATVNELLDWIIESASVYAGI